MRSIDNLVRYSKFVHVVLNVFYILLVMRIFVLYIDIESFKNTDTGLLPIMWQIFLVIQIIIDNISFPLIRPMATLLNEIFEVGYSFEVNFFASIYSIVIIFIIKIFLYLLTKYAIYYIKSSKYD